eukprot:TRINITY_DN1837_c0_g1_i2.p1 TRINITY_DN1837_c0_g1~~TRINITY_DN1837_c0_g1_i2.p1  ORF type:complete len:364 (+),score=83.03 TRINITY_DN1837_c0_g1_i2:63-1094(+)
MAAAGFVACAALPLRALPQQIWSSAAVGAPQSGSTGPANAAVGSSSAGNSASPGSRFWASLGLGLLTAASFRRVRPGSDSRVVVRGRNYETNIKKKKGPAERKQAMVTARHLRQIVLCIKEGGATSNKALDRSIKAAIKDCVPRDTIDRRIKAVVEGSDATQEMEMSGNGPKGTAIIIQCMTDNANRTRDAVKQAFKCISCEVAKPGSCEHFFRRIGVLKFEGTDEERVLEASMEAEAEVEDIVTLEDGTVEVITLQEKFHAACNAFESVGLEPASAERLVRPENQVEVGTEGTYNLQRLLHELEDLDDVGEVHHNAVLQEGVELEFSAYGAPLAWEKSKLAA